MKKPTHISFIIVLLLSLPTLACGAVGVINPEATQTAMEGTVVSLQATITALEDRLPAEQAAQETQQVVVVTATPQPATPTKIAKASAIPASSLGQTLDPTNTPTPATISPQDKTVVVVATFTPTPTPQRYVNAPIILEPRNGAVVLEQREIFLHWSWNGLLKTDEYFDIKIRPDGQSRSAYVAWERGTGHTLVANLAPGRYNWTVQVVKGYFKNNSGEPEDRVFEDYLSPESEPQLLIVDKKRSSDDDDDDDRKTPTATPTNTPEPTATPDNVVTQDADDTSSDDKSEEIDDSADEADEDTNTSDNGSE